MNIPAGTPTSFTLYLFGIKNPSSYSAASPTYVDLIVNAYSSTNFVGFQRLRRAYQICDNTAISTTISGSANVVA